MPRATRKTKTNSGNELSALPKRNTWLKNSALTPSAAEYESTTVAISMIGAITARSSSPRIRNTRSKVMGMITSRSWSAAVAMSRVTAVLPPTIACAPGTACTAVRTARRRHGGDPGCGPQRRQQLGCLRFVAGHDHRLAGAGREVLVDGRLPGHRVRMVPGEGLGVGQAAGLQAGQTQCHHAEHHRSTYPDRPRPD